MLDPLCDLNTRIAFLERKTTSFGTEFKTFQSIIELSKRRQVCTDGHGAAFQKTRIFSNLKCRLNATNAIRHKSAHPTITAPLMLSFHKHCGRSLHVTVPLLHALPISRSFYDFVNYGWHKIVLKLWVNCRNYLVRNSSKRQTDRQTDRRALTRRTLPHSCSHLFLSAGGAPVAPVSTRGAGRH
jgi:hypothetical protein